MDSPKHVSYTLHEHHWKPGSNFWFSVLQQGKPYHQGFVSPGSQPSTVFIRPWGLYLWDCIPFGLTNAPVTFQRFMENRLGYLKDKISIPCLHYINFFSANIDDHVLQPAAYMWKLNYILRVIRFYTLKVAIMGYSFTSWTIRVTRTSWLGPFLITQLNNLSATQLHDSYESHQLTRTLPYNDTRIISVYNEMQEHQIILHVISLKRFPFITKQLVNSYQLHKLNLHFHD